MTLSSCTSTGTKTGDIEDDAYRTNSLTALSTPFY